MTLDEISQHIDALQVGLKEDSFLTRLDAQIKEIDNTCVRIERLKHRINVMEER